MVQVGLLLSDVPTSVPPAQQFYDVRRIVEAAQRNDFTYIAIGQHFLYGDLRWLQPVPLLARLAADVDPNVRLVTQILIAPLYHPVMLAEEIATLDVVTEGRLVFGAGLGYRAEEFDYLDVPYKQRAGRMDESLELMIKLWTEDEVAPPASTSSSRASTPHLRPVQQPYPPIWIGAHSLAGARRAGRSATVTPARRRRPSTRSRALRRVQEGFEARGKEFGPQPLRRNVLVADSRRRRSSSTPGWPRAATSRTPEAGLDVMADTNMEEDFAAAVAGHAVLGSPDR